MKYYSYVRCSTQKQMEENGFQMQLDVIDKYVKEKGIEIDNRFEDAGISGTIIEREGLQDLLSTLSYGDKVIVQNTSRLWRNDSVKVMVHFAMKKVGADIISIEQPTYSVYCTDPNDFLFNGMMELLDQYERMTISMKLAKGRKAKANNGNKACGNTPYGYKWDDKEVVVDYNNDKVVLKIFEKYLEKKSIYSVCEYLHENGYKTARGNDFSPKTVNNILRNDFYIGIVTYADKKYRGNHEPIISESLFYNVQEILDKKKRYEKSGVVLHNI